MPELPEVETIKEAMQKAVSGAVIESAEVYNRNLRIPIPVNFENNICKTKILRVYRIAKYAIMDLSNGCSIIWHFGMSGKIKIDTQKNIVLEKHDHVVLKTNRGTLIYNDPRRFGIVDICSTGTLRDSSLFKHIGLDPFDIKLNQNYLWQKLKSKTTPIKVTLLDQSIIAGIGNIYASEALYAARISPLRESRSLSLKELSTLITAVRSTLEKAIAAGGSTLHDYRKPDGDIGYFQLQHSVYGKDGKHCPNCKNPVHPCGGIKKIIQGGRSTYYCPKQQM